MKYIPNSVTRFASRSALQLSAKSPTLLVVTGVIGLGAAAVLAAKATRKIDPVLEDHAKARIDIEIWVSDGASVQKREEQRALLDLYMNTGIKLGRIYGPSIFVGVTSAISVLGGHRILVGRHVASLAAYSGLFKEFSAYRSRIASTFGVERERELYNGAMLEYEEDPNHKGEYKLKAKYPETRDGSYLRPWFDEDNPNWTRDAHHNAMLLRGIQQYMNDQLQVRGHVFLNDVFDALRIPRCPEGAVVGWLRNPVKGDGYIDFGFMTSQDPQSIGFCNYTEKSVQLNFNIDGNIWELMMEQAGK